MNSGAEFHLPGQFVVSGRISRNLIQQLFRPEETAALDHDGTVVRTTGERTIVTDDKQLISPGSEDVLLSIRSPEAKQVQQWLRPAAIHPSAEQADVARSRVEQVRASWENAFFFRPEGGGGLRPPQLGALHAALAHWTVTGEPATIVLPTGTGKTETMLALLVCQRPERLLVLVPSNALREQIAAKFTTLGLLKILGVVGPEALYPVVGVLEHRFEQPSKVAAFFDRCNVIVSTMNVIGRCSEDVQRRIAELCSHLFIDEAHHTKAPTWEKFRRFFLSRTILQFTATPYRNDGKRLDGSVIFNFPLRKAQDEGYFTPIRFAPIRTFTPRLADANIARAAVAQLRVDLDNGFDHILMARASTIDRALQILPIYRQIAPDLAPQLIHSDLAVQLRRDVLEALRNRASRIVVCVDMFGEGFDFPELKVAALHDPHKSLGIALQFTGRFARTKSSIGSATVIANIADPDVEETLQELYAQDADWNLLLGRLSGDLPRKLAERLDHAAEFTDPPANMSLANVTPAMSTVVYRTQCADWDPKAIEKHFKPRFFWTKPTVHRSERTALWVTRERQPVDWAAAREVFNVSHDLYVVHWDKSRQLLFINSSNNASVHESLARAIAGPSATIIKDGTVFRTLFGIRRLAIMNAGLRHNVSRLLTYTRHAGSDVGASLTKQQLVNRSKSDVFARGFENGERASIGCSTRGRIWSYLRADYITDWVRWCHHIADKLLDESIDPDDVLAGVSIPEEVDERPPLYALAVEWPEKLLMESEHVVFISIDGDELPLHEVGLELLTHAPDEPLRFRVFMESGAEAHYEVELEGDGAHFRPTRESDASIVVGRRKHLLSQWFREEPPVFFLENGGSLTGNQFVAPQSESATLFEATRIAAENWTGVDLHVESQGVTKRPDSIQYRVLRTLERVEPRYDILFDDDGANEAADIVALRIVENRLDIHFFHCKFSKGEPGARVDDLYAVCGQAQRSVHRKRDVSALFDHLRRRDGVRVEAGLPTRFERGDLDALEAMKRHARELNCALEIFVVQPGLSRAAVDGRDGPLNLLAVTELYLRETYNAGFGVIGSG